jgi:molecular chaperone DnaK (HSP70)
MAAWALDLGTTNSALATWDVATGQPQIVELPEVCRRPEGRDPLEAPRMVPTAVHLLDEHGLLARLRHWMPVRRRPPRALIGRPALERNRDFAHPAFVPAFKLALVGEPTRPLARYRRRPVTARAAAAAFLGELLAEVRRTTGERVREIVVTAPVSAFETYRAEVQQIMQTLGVRRVRFLDEPVAAALGYGIGLSRDRHALVVDVGGGTMHVVLVALSARGALAGEARVLAKKGRFLGGNAVDGWVLEEACRLAGLPAPDPEGDEQARFWRRLMMAAACRVKEAVHFDETAVFRVVPPGPGAAPPSLLTFTRAQLVSVLEVNGFYRGLEGCVDSVLADARMAVDDVDDVLLVGGSTLLPGVFARLESRFGRPRIRGWHPFEAVALGAACFAADRAFAADFIVHDYAFVTHEAATGKPQHTIVVPRGTRFPTPPDLWKRQLVPTCSLGEPESIFRLVICEVERADGEGRRFVWDAAGDLQKVGGADGRGEVVVPLNASSPTLGYLDPPHDPRDRRPRLEIAFGVSEERWLVATVHDLLTRRELMHEEPVVRLV